MMWRATLLLVLLLISLSVGGMAWVISALAILVVQGVHLGAEVRHDR